MDLVLYEQIIGALFALYWLGRLFQTSRRPVDAEGDEPTVYPFGVTRARYVQICVFGILIGCGLILIAPLIFGR